MVSFRITIRIRIHNLLIDRFHILYLLRGKNAIEFVDGPGNGSLRDELRCYYAISNFFTDESEFGMRMNHSGYIVTENKKKFKWMKQRIKKNKWMKRVTSELGVDDRYTCIVRYYKKK